MQPCSFPPVQQRENSFSSNLYRKIPFGIDDKNKKGILSIETSPPRDLLHIFHVILLTSQPQRGKQAPFQYGREWRWGKTAESVRHDQAGTDWDGVERLLFRS
jgi:hypothetical protein